MKKLLMYGSALLICGTSALASGLNLHARSGGSNAITVAPGDPVPFEISGVLTDTNNQGLALFGFDVVFSGGPLNQLAYPTTVTSFVSPDGIGNPAGFGGTTNVPGREGELVQVGGAQNTINNVASNAPFPIGVVVTGIGQTETVLATGSLTAPMIPGDYTLSILNAFANVISATQPVGIDFMVVEEATPVIGDTLTITVGTPCGIAGTGLPDCAIDARQPFDPAGANPRGINQLDVTLSQAACAAPTDFTVTCTAGVCPTVTDVVPITGNDVSLVFSGAIPTRAWTCIEIGGTKHCVGSLAGDVDNDGTAAAGDVGALMDCLAGVSTCAIYQCDADDSGACGASDILRVIDLQNGAGVYSASAGVSLGVCPSTP